MRIRGERVWIGGQFMAAELAVENGRIERIEPCGSGAADVDCGRNRLVPGFLDLHTHGALGADAGDGEIEGLRRWQRYLPREGVTSFLPTVVTQKPEAIRRALAAIAKAAREETDAPGAEILGSHLEGPFLDPKYRGAQPADAVDEVSLARFREYEEAAAGTLRAVTLAPEHDPGFSLTRYCAGRGIAVSMGHSGASFETACLAFANGASCVTHTFNGMAPFHHRNPGLAGAALAIPELYGEIICDGLHVALPVLSAFFAAKGRERAIMVTDSLRVKGCPPGGVYRLGGQELTLQADGLARIAGTETIAGSTLAMNRGLRLLVEEALVPFGAALNACTQNPARYLGLSRKGRIAAGCDADLVLLDGEYEVVRAWSRGRELLSGKEEYEGIHL